MEVQHDIERRRFHVALPEGEGVLVYREAGPGVINLWHTEVDPALRGQGVANGLARSAFAYARAAGLQLIATCPFVQGWLKRHPEELDLMAASPQR